MKKGHYKIFWISFIFMAIIQIPFVHQIPTIEQASSLVKDVWPPEGQTTEQINHTYQELLFYWQKPIITIILLVIASFLAFKNKAIFALFFLASVVYFAATSNIEHIAESPGTIIDLLKIEVNTPYMLIYDIIINNVLFLVMYITLTLAYIMFLTRRCS